MRPRRRSAPLRRWPLALPGALLATALAAEEPMGPPAPPQERARRVYTAAGFSGVDDAGLRRALERSRELYVVAAGADFATTNYALDRGGAEANPLVRRRELVVPVKVAAVWGTLRLEERLRREGHDGWARVVRWGFVVLNAGAATWNLAVAP